VLRNLFTQSSASRVEELRNMSSLCGVKVYLNCANGSRVSASVGGLSKNLSLSAMSNSFVDCKTKPCASTTTSNFATCGLGTQPKNVPSPVWFPADFLNCCTLVVLLTGSVSNLTQPSTNKSVQNGTLVMRSVAFATTTPDWKFNASVLELPGVPRLRYSSEDSS